MSCPLLSPPLLQTGRLAVRSIDEMSADYLHRWYVLYTRGRHERQLAFDLNGLDIAYFLPVEKVRGSRRSPVEQIMFPSYMFMFGTIDDRYKVLQTNRVLQVIEVPDQNRLQYELLWLHRMLESGMEVRTTGMIVPGIPCRVVAGAMANHVGNVVAVSEDKMWVSMEIKTLGQLVLFKVPAHELETVTSSEVTDVGVEALHACG